MEGGRGVRDACWNAKGDARGRKSTSAAEEEVELAGERKKRSVEYER